MFCSRKSNNLINKVLKRALRLITNDYQSSFNFLLNKFNEFSVHQRNLQTLMIELYKIIHQIAPPIMNSLFVFRENTHNIRNYQILSNNVRKTVRYGLETILYRSPFLWANLPQEYKLQKSLSAPFFAQQRNSHYYKRYCCYTSTLLANMKAYSRTASSQSQAPVTSLKN